MNKPGSLRAALSAGVPYLKNNPEALRVYIDKGRVVSTGFPAQGFEYRYTLNLVITDYSGDQNILMAAILNWLMVNQADSLANDELRERLFSFEADILRNDLADVAIYLELTERVLVSVSSGLATVKAIPEPGNPEEQDNYWLNNGKP